MVKKTSRGGLEVEVWTENRLQAGPIAERSKSSDLDCGRGDPGSNPSEGRNFFYFLSRW